MIKVSSKSLSDVIVDSFDIKDFEWIETPLIEGIHCALCAKIVEDGKALVCLKHTVYILNSNEYKVIK